jgi:D-aminopeptidase
MRLALALLLAAATAIPSAAQTRPRGRDLGIPFTGRTGPLNAITDVVGVAVGHVTLIEGDGKLVPGKGPIRTGVTAILPPAWQLGSCVRGDVQSKRKWRHDRHQLD